jgi:hypothetical protein
MTKTFASLAAAGLLAAVAFTSATQAATRTQYVFTLAPGGTKSFPIPAVGAPVTLSGTITLRNGGTQTPTALVGALLNQDPSSGQLTWIGTNGDGSQTVGTTLSSAVVASYAFGNAIISASPAPAAGGRGSLTVKQSATTTIIPGTYTLTLTY